MQNQDRIIFSSLSLSLSDTRTLSLTLFQAYRFYTQSLSYTIAHSTMELIRTKGGITQRDATPLLALPRYTKQPSYFVKQPSLFNKEGILYPTLLSKKLGYRIQNSLASLLNRLCILTKKLGCFVYYSLIGTV